MRRTLLIVLILLSYLLPPYVNSPGHTTETILRCNLVLCSMVYSDWSYMPLEDNVIDYGDIVYIYSEVEVRGLVKEGGRYLYNISWRLKVYDPYNVSVLSGTSSTGLKRERVDTIVWKVYWRWQPKHAASLWIFSGEYRVVLEVYDWISGHRVINTTVLIIRNGLTPRLEYRLRNELILENPSGKEVKIPQLSMAVIRTIKPFQIVTSGPSFNVEPTCYVTDEYGNVYALFENIVLKPHSKLVIYSNYTVRINVIKYVNPNTLLSDLMDLPENMTSFIEPEKYIESNSSEIINEALRLKEGVNNVYDICCNIAEFTSTYIEYIDKPVDAGALWTYLNRKGQCIQFSRLYVALARALGIPSQVVSGYGFIDGGLKAVEEGVWYKVSSFHAWVMVYIPGCGWIPVEPQRGSEFFGLIPYTHILLVRNTGRPIQLCGRKWLVTAFHYLYIGPEPKAYMNLYWMVRSLPEELKNLSIDISYYNETVYAGGKLVIEGHLSAPINGTLNIVLRSPVNNVYFHECTFINGYFRLAVNIPAKTTSLGTWLVKLIWPGGLGYTYTEKSLSFEALSKSSSIHLTVPREVTVGDKLSISGYLIPGLANETIVIKLLGPKDIIIVHNATTGIGGEFTLEISTEGFTPGEWRIRVEWSGGERNYVYEGCSVEYVLKVRENLLYKLLLPLVALVVVIMVIVAVLKKLR